jgi:hypothetical protein
MGLCHKLPNLSSRGTLCHICPNLTVEDLTTADSVAVQNGGWLHSRQTTLSCWIVGELGERYRNTVAQQ